MKIYEFNDCQVCTNPSFIYKRKTDKVEIYLAIASFENYWESSISYQTPYSGCGWLPNKLAIKRNKQGFKEAVITGINTVYDRIESTLNDKSSRKPSYLNDLLLKEKSMLKSWVRSLELNDFSLEHILKIELARNAVQTTLF